MGTPSSPSPEVIRFGVYELNVRTNELRKHGIRLRMQEQPLQVLLTLLERSGELVTREEIRNRVWPQNTFVSFDHALNTAVKKIRATLNDDADAPRFIETVPRRGYRFIAPVHAAVPAAVTAAEPEPSVEIEEEKVSLLNKWLRPRNIAIGISALVLLAVLAFYMNSLRARAIVGIPGKRVMVAVLPFQNMSGDPSQEYFSDGMTEETITQLGRLHSDQLGVIARTSAMKYKHAAKSIEEIGRELHVDYVLEGSIRRQGNRVRIEAQLIRTSDQSPRWSRDFDRNLSDAISLETDVATAIANEIDSTLGSHSPVQTLSTPTVAPDAYDAYLRGHTQSPIRSVEGLQRVLAIYQEGLRDDPNCQRTWTGIASAYDFAGNHGILPPHEAFTKTKEAALKAIQLDPAESEAHVYLADALLTEDLDWVGAEKEIRRALALNPNDAIAHQWYGMYLCLLGKLDAAIAEFKRSIELDPLSTERLYAFACALFQAKRFDEAETYLKMALDVDPSLAKAHTFLRDLYEQQGKYDKALAEMVTTYRILEENEAITAMQQTYALAGYTAAKQAALRQDIAYLKAMAKQHYVSSYAMARDYAQMGDKDQALTHLEKAFSERDTELVFLREESDFTFSNISGDPRFAALIHQIGYPQRN